MASPSMPKSPLYDGCPSNVSWNRVTHFQSSSPWPSSSSTFEKRPVDKVGLTGTGQDDEAMSETDEEEWEFEETEDLVMLDVGGKSARLAHMSHDYNITGLESDHPFFKLGNLTFKGRWDQLLGTELLLHLDRDPSQAKDQQTVVTPMSSTSRSSSHSQPQTSLPLPPPSLSSSSLPTVPGTIARRIVLEPASNLSEREAALLRPLQTSSTASATEISAAAASALSTAPVAQRRDAGGSGTKAPLAVVSYKNHRWLKGVGWVHKDDVGEAINAQADEGQDSNDGDSDEEAAGEEKTGDSGKRVGTNGDEVDGDEDVEEEEEEEEGEEGAPTNGEQAGAAAVKLTRRGKPKRKRQPMTEVQKAKANLKRALLRLEKDNPNLRSELEERKKAQIEDEQEEGAGTDEGRKGADGNEGDGRPQAEEQMDLSQE